MEGKTHYENIVGGTQKEKDLALAQLEEVFNDRSKTLSEYELEKTPEDLEILNVVESMVDRMVKQYGGKPKPLPLDHIYVLREGSVLKMTGGKLAGGIHKPFGLNIGIEKGKSKLLFANVLAHELFHLKSYKSARVGKSGEDVHLYRSGLSMFDKKDPNIEAGKEREYFGNLEEAIVAECTKKLQREIEKEEAFSEEAVAIAKFKDWVVAYYVGRGISKEKIKEVEGEVIFISDPQDKVERVVASSDDEKERQAYAAGMFSAMYKQGEVREVARYSERKKLYELLDNLVASSKGQFKSRDEIFNEFAKANFSGNYLPLARIIEGILGKGSFRKIAEEF